MASTLHYLNNTNSKRVVYRVDDINGPILNCLSSRELSGKAHQKGTISHQTSQRIFIRCLGGHVPKRDLGREGLPEPEQLGQVGDPFDGERQYLNFPPKRGRNGMDTEKLWHEEGLFGHEGRVGLLR